MNRNNESNVFATSSHAIPTRAATDHSPARLARLEGAIEHAAHLLPAQGPITVFIHHNTLHALEEQPFEEAVKQGARIFGCQPYLTEMQYRDHLARGRIRQEDLSAVLLEDLDDEADVLIGLFGTRYHLRLAMLAQDLHQAPDAELRWFVAKTDALRRFRDDVSAQVRQRMIQETRHWVLRDVLWTDPDGGGRSPHERRAYEVVKELVREFGQSSIERWSDRTWEAFTLRALWRICREGVHGLPHHESHSAPPPRHRNLLLQATGEDSDRLVHDLLIRFCAAFLDQGFAAWPLPFREEGFYRCFFRVYGQAGGPPEPWLAGLREELARLQHDGIGPLESIEESLNMLGVPEGQWESFLTDTFLALRGWGGMIRQIELRADRAAHPVPEGSITEFLAIRLILDRLALKFLAREALNFTGPLHQLRQTCSNLLPRHEASSVDQRAFLVFQLAQVRGFLPSDLHKLTRPQWTKLIAELEAFSSLERRRIFHLAFERRYRIRALDALSIHASDPPVQPEAPEFQVSCCLDEREESFRRHLEEVCPEVETFGVAGFYAVAMYYRGAAEAHSVPLCPIIVRPNNWVQENVVSSHEELHRRRAKTRRAIGTAAHRVHLGSRTFAGGALVSALFGMFASVPLVARVLFPRLTAKVRQLAGRLVQPPPLTQLQLERCHPEPGPDNGHVGFLVDEMTIIAQKALQELGISRYSPLVILLGHGSRSLNNPHNSAYNCGACGGGAGGPNARAAAKILNDPRVRANLADHGIVIPESTVFVGGLHNTCDDSVTYYDLDQLPASHTERFEKARRAIEAACDRNAHERCRRFQSAPLDLTFEEARRHVEDRAEDLAQTRPELGHATNALCIVGRRSRTRGLFMDRRAFLTSYDPEQDDEEHSLLTRILQAAVPVCAGINLEYYFSLVDSTGWGCGTKLPHNVSCLLGVMDGHASDLRTGLPWQMVEIHEPVRLLFVVETTPEAMLKIMDRNPGIGVVCRNRWVQLAVLSPNSPEIHLYHQGRFERYRPESLHLPEVASSVDWYRGWREHLGFARIRPSRSAAGNGKA